MGEIYIQLEECMICFEETYKFILFSCNHKVCHVCFPKLNECPLCQSFNKVKVRQPERDYMLPNYCYICFTFRSFK